jgi:hypothetical protein
VQRGILRLFALQLQGCIALIFVMQFIGAARILSHKKCRLSRLLRKLLSALLS